VEENVRELKEIRGEARAENISKQESATEGKPELRKLDSQV
jgi:hypothetical protein